MIEHWWPWIVILVAGFLATDIWRWLGVLVGHRLKEDSEALHYVRAIATALVMAVTAKLVVFPSGTLAHSPLWLRLGALGIGFVAFLLTGQKVGVGIAVSLILLAVGLYGLGV